MTKLLILEQEKLMVNISNGDAVQETLWKHKKNVTNNGNEIDNNTIIIAVEINTTIKIKSIISLTKKGEDTTTKIRNQNQIINTIQILRTDSLKRSNS